MRGLYERIEEEKDQFETHVRLSYLEIYNETIRDLLSPTPTPPGPGLALREDAASKISVVGITEHIPESPEQVLAMITEGNKRRTQSPTEANAVSSRSHAVLQLNVTRKPRTAGTVEEMSSASLNIIDLAGSERAAATNNQGMRMKEGANINRSLLALGSCINALCQTGGARNVKGRHIPYRNSKLTRLLKFSLGGNCKTVMIVCVSPSSAHYDETHNTLKYANQAKNIQTKVTRNLLHIDRHVAQYVQAIASLRQEVQELKEKLAAAGGDAPAERRRKETLLADAIHQLQTEAETQRAAHRQAAVDAAPLHAAEALRRALSAAATTSAAQDRAVLETLLEQTPRSAAPPETSYTLAAPAPPPALAADASSMAVYAARRAHLEATLAAEAHAAALNASRTLLQDTIGRRMVDLALGSAHATQALRTAADQLAHSHEALACTLRTASEVSDAALQRAMGTSVLGPAREKRRAVEASPRRKPRTSVARPTTEAGRLLRMVSPRRRALRPGVVPRHKSVGNVDKSEPPRPVPAPKPPLPVRVSLAPGPRASIAPGEPAKGALRPDATRSGPMARKSLAPEALARKPALERGDTTEKRPEAEKRLAEKRPDRPRVSVAPKPAQPQQPRPEPAASAPASETRRDAAPDAAPLEVPPSSAPAAPPAAAARPENTSPPGVKRRGLFQRKFLAKPDTDEGDSSMDSLLQTDLGDLSAQIPHEDWQTGLLEVSGRSAGSNPTATPPRTSGAERPKS